MILVVSEKPSVAQQIAHVLGAETRKEGYLEGENYLVSWCLGHLAEYVPPEFYDPRYKEWNFADLPIIPKEWQLSVASDKRDQFNVVKGLLNRSDLQYAVNACDAGREGELIFKRVYDLSESRIPVKRLWINSMEDSAILDGFQNLKDASEYQGLADAAVCRAQADWLVGMNATRAYTTVYYRTLRVGRVQTPTLSMLVERENQMRGFIKEKYYHVYAKANGLDLRSDQIKNSGEARDLMVQIYGKDMKITLVDTKLKTVNPPKLYDLTTLQRMANRFYGYTAKETLDAAQTLYEAKLITYPRTDSQYITCEMQDTFGQLVQKLCGLDEMSAFTEIYLKPENLSRVVNNAKVTDHHAIIVTDHFLEAEKDELTERQKNILHMIWARMILSVQDPFLYYETNIQADCDGNVFSEKKKTISEKGWKEFSFLEKSMKDEEESDLSDEKIMVREGDVLSNVEAAVSEHFTNPPKPFTEDSLLQAMERAGNKEFDSDTERKGLGTPATRASIIEKLVHSGYARRKEKQIIPTEEGMEMMEVLPDILKSASMTANWENQLMEMEHGQIDPTRFMQGIKGLVSSVLNGCEAISDDERQRFRMLDSIGTCPKCGSLVFEGRRNFYCKNKECDFVLWKENYYLTNMGKKVDAKMAAEMLKTGRTHCKNLASARTGKLFEADIVLDTSGERVKFNLEFPQKYDNSQRKGKRK